jgi:hypothetical protein
LKPSGFVQFLINHQLIIPLIRKRVWPDFHARFCPKYSFWCFRAPPKKFENSMALSKKASWSQTVFIAQNSTNAANYRENRSDERNSFKLAYLNKSNLNRDRHRAGQNIFALIIFVYAFKSETFFNENFDFLSCSAASAIELSGIGSSR